MLRTIYNLDYILGQELAISQNLVGATEASGRLFTKLERVKKLVRSYFDEGELDDETPDAALKTPFGGSRSHNNEVAGPTVTVPIEALSFEKTILDRVEAVESQMHKVKALLTHLETDATK